MCTNFNAFDACCCNFKLFILHMNLFPYIPIPSSSLNLTSPYVHGYYTSLQDFKSITLKIPYSWPQSSQQRAL